MKLATFALITYQSKKKRTRREIFLAEMDQVVLWLELVALIEPHYPKPSWRGRQSILLWSILRT